MSDELRQCHRATGARLLPRVPQVLALAGLLAFGALSGTAGAREPVRSFQELRAEGVVLQEFDLSCGAAALATLLAYQHGDPVPEREIALGLMSREEYLANPDMVRMQQGFSLLDLKRFSEARGYRGTGLGGLTLDLAIARAPMIIPIETNGYRHFVILRGRAGNRVLLADPAFGNRTMLASRFERSWLTAGELGRVGFIVERGDGKADRSVLQARSRDFVMIR